MAKGDVLISMSFADSSDENSKQKVAANGWVRPDGRIELDRDRRDDIRRVVVPLELADMNPAGPALKLRTQWHEFFDRPLRQSGQSVASVRQLREWLDQPQARGLTKISPGFNVGTGFSITSTRWSWVMRMARIVFPPPGSPIIASASWVSRPYCTDKLVYGDFASLCLPSPYLRRSA